MKRVLFPILALALLASLALPMATPAAASDPVPPEPPAWTGYYALKGGQNIPVGCVRVGNSADYLYVRYEMNECWELRETHVAVATSLAGIPQNKNGNPKVGHFAYQMKHLPPVAEYTYIIDLNWTPGIPICIATHAVVFNTCDPQEETAWTCGDYAFPGRNWARYFIYWVQPPPTP